MLVYIVLLPQGIEHSIQPSNISDCYFAFNFIKITRDRMLYLALGNDGFLQAPVTGIFYRYLHIDIVLKVPSINV